MHVANVIGGWVNNNFRFAGLMLTAWCVWIIYLIGGVDVGDAFHLTIGVGFYVVCR
jgi:hypothetical protein